jgi:uncharacterized protein involved in outer membrane biogenesis
MAAVLLAIVGGLAFVLLQRALHSDRLRGAAEARLSAMLGQRVTIGDIQVALFPRAALTGSDISIGEAGTEAPAVRLHRIHIIPRLRSLLSGDVIVRELDLEGLMVSVLRDRAGRWHVPAAVPGPTGGGEGGVVIERVRVTGGRARVFDELSNGKLREASSIDDMAAEAAIEGGGLRLSPITGRIGGAAIAGQARTDAQAARLEFTAKSITDDDLPALLRLLGTERPAFLRLPEAASASAALRIDRATSRLSGTGSVRAPQVSIDPLRLQAFDAAFTIDGSRLVFSPTAFRIYGGSHQGTVAIDLGESPARWSTDSRTESVDMGDFVKALTAADAQIDGTGAVRTAFAGRVGEPLDRTVQGTANVVLVDGVILRFPLLAFVNRALRLSEGDTRDTRFERLSATLAVARGQATTNDLVIRAGHMRVEAAGRIGFDRSLALSGHAVFSPERTSEATRSVRELSAMRNSRGELELPLTISGTLDNPAFKVDLKSAIGQSIKGEIFRRFRGVIRGPDR